MAYSLIGSGNVGTALARQFARNGIDVGIANARGSDSLVSLKKELGRHVIPQALEVALQASMVILAVPFASVAGLARSVNDWTGKIVVDATNAIDLPSYKPTDLNGRLSSELIAERLRPADVVKAFNTLPAAVLGSDPREGPGRRVIFVSGNNEKATSEVAGLAMRLGFAAITLGRLSEGGLLQQLGGPLALQNLLKIG
jgi:8-hydroxy-5-deazaflavin:NADPH oxidoreductase